MHKRSIDYHLSTGLQSLNSLYGSSSRFFIINCLLLNQLITSEIIDNWIFTRPQICVYRGWAPTTKVLETRTPKALNWMITVLMRHWKREFSVWHLWLIKKKLAIPYFINVFNHMHGHHFLTSFCYFGNDFSSLTLFFNQRRPISQACHKNYYVTVYQSKIKL